MRSISMLFFLHFRRIQTAPCVFLFFVFFCLVVNF
uniref:Uncharacterized protein n=1 Tax=Anopheles dirus TaxID=7168 RepID=A0A182NYK6_9DIPT